MRQAYANPAHPVFQLVEPKYRELLEECYDRIGRPAVNIQSCWDVYTALRNAVLSTVPGDPKPWIRSMQDKLGAWHRSHKTRDDIELLDCDDMRGDYILPPHSALEPDYDPEYDSDYVPTDSSADEDEVRRSLGPEASETSFHPPRVQFSRLSSVDSLAGLRNLDDDDDDTSASRSGPGPSQSAWEGSTSDDLDDLEFF